jgi:hypothetical protein
MNKLEEYRDMEAKDAYQTDVRNDRVANAYKDGVETGFIKGFDAAIALNLPVKFAEWQINEGITYYNPDGKIEFPNSYFRKDNHSMDIETPQELYQYWIENIYKSE